MEISFKQTIFSLEAKNKRCNDCGDENVKFVSVNNGITLCELCAQIHQNLGFQISYIKSIDSDFDDYLMNYFIYGGNKKFKKTLRQMGVNLDMKKSQLYRTYGADFYRRNLKSIVKGNSHLDKDFENASEVMKIESNAFPEFENYVINNYKSNQINVKEDINLNILNNLEINLNSNVPNTENGVLNNPLENNNNKENEIKIEKENKIESVQSQPENEGGNGEKKEENKNLDLKKVMDSSIKNIKKFGGFVKNEGIKGLGIMKKYGNILVDKSKPKLQSAKNYLKEHLPFFNKNKNKQQDKKENQDNQTDNEENKKEDEKNNENNVNNEKIEEKKEEKSEEIKEENKEEKK